jgi:hypothetical protein
LRCAAAILPAILAGGCLASLPTVDPSQFACTGDEPDGKDRLQCPEADFCSDGACAERLGCSLPGAARPGCDPEQKCENARQMCMRCDAHFHGRTDSVSCSSGIHTTTSTRPKNLETCDCPDGTYCVAFADAPIMDDAYPLFLLPPGIRIPIPQLGLAAEKAAFRICARVCSSELDCSANHTCRAAPVVSDDLIANPSSTRHTIGVCYPEAFAITSTTAMAPMPNALACESEVECFARGIRGPCQYRVLNVPDHPSVPAGSAWTPASHRALIARCVEPTQANNLAPDDSGCTRGEACRSGLCVGGKCAKPCNEHLKDSCPSTRGCFDRLEAREISGAGTVEDRVQVCGKP